MTKPIRSKWLDVLFALLLAPFFAALFCLFTIVFLLPLLGLAFIFYLPAIFFGSFLWLALLVIEEKRWWIWFLGFSGLGYAWVYFHLYFSRPELLETKIFSPDALVVTLVVTLTFGGVGFLLWLHHRMRERRQQASKLRDEIKKLEDIEMGVL